MTTALNLMKTAAKNFAIKSHGHFINNEWCDSQDKRYFDVYDPSCAKVITQVSLASSIEVDRAVMSARQSFERGVWSSKKYMDKAKVLWKVADLIEQNADILAELESLDNGKPFSVAKIADVSLAAEQFRYYATLCTKTDGNLINISLPFDKNTNYHAYSSKEPIGVVAQIIPWNFPLLMAAWKLAPALTAGCSMILKPAEQTPLSAAYLMNLLQEAGIPKGVVNLVNGDGSTGALLSAHPDVDKVAFTGSTEVGKLIVQSASSNLKKVSLELGGKSPNIIFKDCDIQKAILGAANAIFFNHGQCCCAGSRLFIQESIYEEVLDGVKNIAKNIRVEVGMSENSMMGPLVSKEQFSKVTNYIVDGVKEGALLISNNQQKEDGYFVYPTILANTNKNMKVVKEEIFGPVLCAQKFNNEEEVIQEANDSIYGLAAGIWTNDLNKAHRVSKKLRSGTVWINCYNVFDAALPFGGYKQSGWGREMGYEALNLYTETKSVCIEVAD